MNWVWALLSGVLSIIIWEYFKSNPRTIIGYEFYLKPKEKHKGENW